MKTNYLQSDTKGEKPLKWYPKTKTNNLEDFDKIINKIGDWYIIKAEGRMTVGYDEIKQFILNREKALLNKPLGVSQWKEMGKKYGYDKYFEKALLTDIKSKIDKEIERWEKVDEESSSYKISALYDLRKKL
uniref:Uncharacterized protein n=1 Tax=viral metagenome TaxID=1070528 RepID=A0A6M3LUB0_9ZZZZ